MSLVLQEINKQYIATPQGMEQVYQNRLVEGRDFERWDWLKATVPLGDVMLILPIENCLELKYKYQVSQVGNINVMQTETGYSYFIQTTINDFKIYKTSTINSYNYGINGYYEFEFGDNFLVNAKKVARYGSPITIRITNNTNGVRTAIFSISEIELNGMIKYFPVKLLSPCPPNLSANGKAYPIGECGMIDSVSGKFYGNSGSGSFSVYNDPTE